MFVGKSIVYIYTFYRVNSVPCGRSIIIVLFYLGPLGCVYVCWRGDHPGPEVSPQSSLANANCPWRRPSLHRNIGCRLQQLENQPKPKKKKNTIYLLKMAFLSLQSCLGLMLTGDQAGQFLKNALRLNTSFFGPTDLHTALK